MLMASVCEVPAVSDAHTVFPLPCAPPSSPHRMTNKSGAGRRRKRVDPRRNRSGSRGSHSVSTYAAKASKRHEFSVPSETRDVSPLSRKRCIAGTEGEATKFTAPVQNAVTDMSLDPTTATPDDLVGPADERRSPAPGSPKRMDRSSPPPSRSPSPVRDSVGYTDDPPSPRHDDRPTTPVNSWDYPCNFNPDVGRTLQLEYWDRTRECKERKWNHMDYIDATYPSREEWINRSVLAEAEILLEPNMFAYNTPRGIEHWTLWSRHDLQLHEVEEYVSGWIKRERPEVVRWNLDENAERSINIYHVHVYFQVVPDDEVRPPVVEEECDRKDRGPDEAAGEGDGVGRGRDDEQGDDDERRQGDDDVPSSKRARMN